MPSDLRQTKENASTQSNANDGGSGSPEDGDLQHAQILAHARSVSTPPATPAITDEIEIDITSKDVSEHAPGLYVARSGIRPPSLTGHEIDDILQRLNVDLTLACARIRARSCRKPPKKPNEDMLMIDMRMAGTPARGSTIVTLRPCIWVFCGSKWCQKIVKRDVKALNWLGPYEVHFVRKGGPLLSAGETSSVRVGTGRARNTGYVLRSFDALSLSDYNPLGPRSDYYDSSYTDACGSSYEPTYTSDDALAAQSSHSQTPLPSHSNSYPATSATSSTGAYQYQSELSSTSTYGGYTGYDTLSVASSSVPSCGYSGGGSVSGWSESPGSQVRHESSRRSHHSRLSQVQEDVAGESSSRRNHQRSDRNRSDRHRSDHHPSDNRRDDRDRDRDSYRYRSEFHDLPHTDVYGTSFEPVHTGGDHDVANAPNSNHSLFDGHDSAHVTRIVPLYGDGSASGKINPVIKGFELKDQKEQYGGPKSNSAKYHSGGIALWSSVELRLQLGLHRSASLIGLNCISTTWRGHTELSRSVYKMGGAISLSFGEQTSLYGVTSGHGMIHQLLDVAPERSGGEDSSIHEFSESSDSESEVEEESPSFSAESDGSGDKASVDSAVDLSDHTAWWPIDHDITADFLGIGVRPASQRDSQPDETHVKDALFGDLALFPIDSFHRSGLTNYYIDPSNLEVKDVTSISENEVESTISVFVLLGPEKTVSGTLQPGKFHFSMRGTSIDARQIRLSRDLAMGSSGSWVVHDQTLYGMIIAVVPGTCGDRAAISQWKQSSISYTIYLKHGPVIHAIGYATEHWAWSVTGIEGWRHNAGFTLTSVFVVPNVI